MPHIKLEHTENVSINLIKAVFKKLIVILLENANVKERNCKCKAIQIPVYAMGIGANSIYYYHLEILLLKGRSKDIIEKIGQQSLQVLKDCFTNQNRKRVKQFSVEIRDINPDCYFTSNTI